MSEPASKQILQKARDLHMNLKIPSSEIENHLSYLKQRASQKPAFIPCGCLGSKVSQVHRVFDRGLSNFNEHERIQFYYTNVKIVRDILDSTNEEDYKFDKDTQVLSIYAFNQNEKDWQLRQTDVDYIKKAMTFKSNRQTLDFHNYILRSSKKTDRKCLALQSVEALQTPQILRVSNGKNNSFESFEDFLTKLVNSAIRDNYINKMEFAGKIQKRESLVLSRKVSKGDPTNNRQSLNTLVKQQPTQLETLLQKRQCTQQQSSRVTATFGKKEQTEYKIKTTQSTFCGQQDVISRLESFDNPLGFQQYRKDVLVDLKNNRLRKIYMFDLTAEPIPIDWIIDNLMFSSCFKRYKRSLKHTKSISIPKSSYQKYFYQNHLYKNRVNASYIYKRSKVLHKNYIVFFDQTPTESTGFKQRPTGKIQYCLYRISRSQQSLGIIVEAKVNHGQNLTGYDSLKLTDQFLGELSSIVLNVNMTFVNQTELSIKTIIFDEHYLEEIQNNNQIDDLDQFYTIPDPEETRQPLLTSNIKQLITKTSARRSLQSPLASNRLKFSHIIRPLDKQQAKYRLPKVKGEHPYFQGEFKFTQKGEMIGSNQQKIAAQSGVLSEVLKSIGKNLFSGKSILSISMPVTVFSNESNLSLLCKSYVYAPLLLEKAARQKTPENRLKYVVAFMISCEIAYIRMDKPFNPILGETFQTLLDGCPIYGQQVSHHPPISSTFMKGRGYTIYGSFEAKVNMGLNSATGSNDGICHISFDQSNFRRKIVKFDFPAGQISGLITGNRQLAIVKTCHFLDVQNMVYLQLNFGKHKGQTEYCKMRDGIEGKIIQLQKNADVSDLAKINKKKAVKELGVISGRWTHQVYFQQQLIFDSWKDMPFQFLSYPCPLESDAYYRKDLRKKVENNLQEAQTAKQQLEEIQRNDRKLRAKYTGKSH